MALLGRPEFLNPQASADDLGGHAEPAANVIGDDGGASMRARSFSARATT
jgi:hypothetical protein